MAQDDALPFPRGEDGQGLRELGLLEDFCGGVVEREIGRLRHGLETASAELVGVEVDQGAAGIGRGRTSVEPRPLTYSRS